MKKFDAIIIGSGQAGTPLVYDLAAKGQKVAIIEKKNVGGTCLNVGCTPTKTYVASARRMWDIANGNDLGIEVEGTFKANMLKVKMRKDDLLNASRKKILDSLHSNESITFYNGAARFISNYEVEINGEKITAPKIFINVGGRPVIPTEYMNVNYLTNESILDLDSLPEHLIIIGGSYIGLEFGQMFKRFGSEVTIIERGSRVISREDLEVSEEITSFMKHDGVQFVYDAKNISVRESESKFEIIINNSQTITGSHLLLAIGRVPNTDNMGIEKTDIKLNSRGFIEVNDYCETNMSGIFALGDCNGKGAFTHTAYNDFQIVQNYLFGDQTRKISDRIQTYGLFVDPPLGRCGLTKAQALEQGIKVLEGRREMKTIARAKEKGETYGFMQILVDADNEKIIGACVLGVGGDEIITSVLNIMNSGMSYKVIRDSVVPHPTISELIPTTLENLTELN